MRLLFALVLLVCSLGIADPQTIPAPTIDPTPVSVEQPWGPYEDPTAALVCHIDRNTYTPIVADGKFRCFLVPVAVSAATMRFMLTQTEGMENGKIKYKYASWWDFVVRHFVTTVVLPHLEQFPPPELAAAKAQAEAAIKAVDAAKAAIIDAAVDATVNSPTP